MTSWNAIKQRLGRMPAQPVGPPAAEAEDGTASLGTDAPKRVLVVVDRALVDINSLPGPVLVAERKAEEVYVVAPVLTNRAEWLTSDTDRATGEAQDRLAIVLDRMRVEQRVAATGRVGDESPLVSISDALMGFAADEIIIVRSGDQRHWHERDLARKVRHQYAQPVIEVVVHANGSASIL